MDGLFDKINTVRSTLVQTQPDFGAKGQSITNLANISENTAAAKGRITDADSVAESSNMVLKNQMLMQAGTTVLSTNQLL